MMFLGELVDAIAAIQLLGDKIKHNAFALSVLAKVGHEFKEPPPDFDGIYVFALIEYGRNRPKSYTQLFADEGVKNAFRLLFEERNRGPIVEEVDRFIETFLGGQELRRLEHNPDSEIRSFEQIFRKQVDRTRLPKEKEEHERIEKLQQAFVTGEAQRGELKRSIETISAELLRQRDLSVSRARELPLLAVTKDYLPDRPRYCASRTSFLAQVAEQCSNRTWLAITGAAGTGKTQTARALADRLSPDASWWVSLRSRADEEATRHLGNQLALWLVNVSGMDDLYYSHTTGRAGLDSVVRKVAEETTGRGVLVVDDLPDALAGAGIFSTLALVASIFEQHSCRIITTGHKALPASLISNLGRAIFSTTVPPLSTDEIQELLEAAQAPATVTNHKVASLLLGQTSGNPAMVLATIQWLKHNHWRIQDAIFSSSPTAQLRHDERRRILALCNPEQRDLLYRLTFIGAPFGQQLATRLATVPPPIRFPASILEELTGPWIEQLGDGRLQVSPLLAEAGEGNFDEPTLTALHQTIAADYVSRKAITPNDALRLFHHLLAAKEFNRAVGTIVQLMMSAEGQAQAKQIDLLSYIYTSGIEWPQQFDLNTRIIIRASQVRIRALAEEPLDDLDQDLERLLSQATDENQHALLFAYVNAGPLATGIPTFTAIRRSVRAIPVIQKLSEILPPEAVDGAGNLVWFALLQRPGVDSVFVLLEELRNLRHRERMRVFDSELAAEGSCLLLDKLWMVEADKPEGERNWGELLNKIDAVHATCEELGLEPLKAAAIRCKAVIICDYLNDPGSALDVLNRQAGEFEPPQQFLLAYTQSLVEVASGNEDKAIETIQHALRINTQEFAAFHTESRRRLIQLYEQSGQLGEAKELCIECIKAPIEVGMIESLECSEFLGELSWIHFRSGDWPRTMTAIHSAIQVLADQDTTTARFKEVFNKLVHAIGWFSSMAATGHPPPETLAGGVYAPVIDGFFVMRRPRLGQYDQPLGFHLFNLYVQVATLADTLGLLRTTWHVHTTLKQLLSSHKGHPIYGAYQPLAASLEATFGSFDDAVGCGLLAAKFVEIAREWVQRTDIHSKFPPGEIIEHNWRERTSDQRAIAQQFLLYIVFGPAFARMLVESKDATDTEMRIDACNQAMAAYRGEFEDATYWQETIGRFGDCLLARQQGNWGAIQESPTNHSVMQALALWVSSENPTAKLTANFSKQLLVADFLRTTDRVGRYIRWYFNQFLHSYWLNIAMTRRFALRDPDLFLSDLRATKITAHTATTVRILHLAAGALGISIPSSIQLDSQT